MLLASFMTEFVQDYVEIIYKRFKGIAKAVHGVCYEIEHDFDSLCVLEMHNHLCT